MAPMAKEIDTKTLEKVRGKIQAAAFRGMEGMELESLFSRLDKDASGELDLDEWRICVRTKLKISVSDLRDEEIDLVFNALDADQGGTISMDELVRFVGQTEDPELVKAARRRAILKQERRRHALENQLEDAMDGGEMLRVGEVVFVTRDEAALREAYNAALPRGDWWHPAIKEMLGQEFPIAQLYKGMIYLPIPDSNTIAARANKNIPSMQKFKDRIAFPVQCLQRVYFIGFELDKDEYTAKVLDRRLPSEAEVGRKRGMTHLIEYITGPLGPGGREWISLDEDRLLLRDEYGHCIPYGEIEAYQQPFRKLKNRSAWPTSPIPQGLQRRVAVRSAQASRPPAADGDSSGSESASSGSSSFLDSAFDDMSSPSWSNSDEMSTTAEDRPKTTGARVPPGGHCAPDLKREQIVERLYDRDVARRTFIQSQLHEQRLHQNHIDEDMCLQVEKHTGLSADELDQAFNRLYKDAETKRKRQQRTAEQQQKNEAEAWQLNLPKSRVEATAYDEGSDPEAPHHEKLYKAGMRRMEEKAEAHAALNEPRSWSPIKDKTDVAERLYADHMRRHWKKEAARQETEERERQKSFDNATHPLPANKAYVEGMIERLHSNDTSRRMQWVTKQRQLRDGLIDQSISVVSPRSPVAPGSPARTQLLFEDAHRRNQDRRMTERLRETQDEEMLRSTSVHREYHGTKHSGDHVKQIFSRIGRSKSKIAKGGPSRAFTKMIRAAHQNEPDDEETFYQSQRTQRRSLSPSTLRGRFQNDEDFVVGVFCPSPLTAEAEMFHKNMSHGKKKSYIGETKLRAALTNDEVANLDEYGVFAVKERRAREDRLSRLARREPSPRSPITAPRLSSKDQTAAVPEESLLIELQKSRDDDAEADSDGFEDEEDGEDEEEPWVNPRQRMTTQMSSRASFLRAWGCGDKYDIQPSPRRRQTKKVVEVIAKPPPSTNQEEAGRSAASSTPVKAAEVKPSPSVKITLSPPEVIRKEGSNRLAVVASSSLLTPSATVRPQGSVRPVKVVVKDDNAPGTGRAAKSEPLSDSSKQDGNRCEHCEAMLTDDSRFCRQCGKRCYNPLASDFEFDDTVVERMVGGILMVQKIPPTVDAVTDEGLPSPSRGSAMPSFQERGPDPHAGTLAKAVSKEWEDKEPLPIHGLFIHEDFGLLHIGKDPQKIPGQLICDRPIETQHSACLRLSAWPIGPRSRCNECQKAWDMWALKETITERAKAAAKNAKQKAAAQALGEKDKGQRPSVSNASPVLGPDGSPIAPNGDDGDAPQRRGSLGSEQSAGQRSNSEDGAQGDSNEAGGGAVQIKKKTKKPAANIALEVAGLDILEIGTRKLTAEDRERIRAQRLGIRRFSAIVERNEGDEEADADGGKDEDKKSKKKAKAKGAAKGAAKGTAKSKAKATAKAKAKAAA